MNSVANVKIKNNLLAMVLIATSIPLSVQVSKLVIEQMCSDIGRYMGAGDERPELGLTAIHCATSLLVASLRPMPGQPPRPSPVLQYAAMCVLTPMIQHVADTVVSVAAGSAGPRAVEGVGEVIRGLVTWCGGLPEDVKPRGYGILLPTLCLLLDPTGVEKPSGLHKVATNTMLQLAQNSPKAFKDATQAMAEGERAGLEKAVRDAVAQAGSSAASGAGAQEKKGIALKSFG